MATKRGCTQCGTCLNTCPVYNLIRREEVSPKAKQELLADAGRKNTTLNWQRTLDLSNFCASCGRCFAVCPRHLSVPEALNRARALNPGWRQKFWKLWINGRRALWPAAKHLAPLWPHSLLPEKLACLQDSARAMAQPAKVEPLIRLSADAGRPLEGVTCAIFGGCTAENLRPQWISRTKALLTALGATIAEGRFGCCGGTFEHAGLPDAAAESARTNIEIWRSLGKPVMVTFCASCLHGLKSYADLPDVLGEEERTTWLNRVKPLSALLEKVPFDVTGADDLAARAYYHSPCHWLPGKDLDFRLLSRLFPGLRKGKSLC